MAKKIYLNFDLLIEQVAEGYTIRVFDSPGGQAKAQFTLPFEDHELKNFFVQIGHPRSIEHQETHFRDQSERETVKEFGSRLFKTIFKDEVWDCLSKSLHEINSKEDVGLRIRLRLVDAPKLADVPWEYLYIPTLKRFLALSVDTPIVRYLRLPEGIKTLSLKLPLKILVMISNARDYPALDVNSELDKLNKAMGDLEQKGLVKLELLESATLSALQDQLLKDEYHVFHFIGHGGFDNQAQDGVLILEDEDGNGRKVNGQKLGTILHDEHTLRLVVLNACEGARTSRTDPFAGTAQSLVQQGIPAVIAMQFEITDKAAITLSHTFYRSVAEGYPVDSSLAEARKAINSEEDFNSVEWGTPVLYMRSSDGNIFNIDPKEILIDEARSAMKQKDWKNAIGKWQAVLDIDKNIIEAKKGLNRARWMKYRQRLWIGISALALGVVIFRLFGCPPKSVDLMIDSFSIPGTVTQGDTVQVTATVRNSGNAAAKDVLVRWWPNTADTTVYIDSIPEIGVGRTDSIGFTHPGYPHPGEFITRFTVNLGGDERDYLSIDSTMMIVVSSESDTSLLPDLEIIAFQLEPANPREGSEVTLRATIRNNGNSPASNVVYKWWPDDADTTVYIDSIPEIGVGRTDSISFTHPGYPDSDLITTRLTVNPEGSINERSYTDNTVSREIYVSSSSVPPVEYAELTISYSSVPDTVTQGDTVQVTASVHNSGNADASNVLVEWWPVAGSSIPLTDTIPEIESEDTAYANFTYSGYPSTGSITTELKVNSNKATTEVNDHNNSCTTTIEVTSPDPKHVDLSIVNLSLSPIMQQQVTATVEIHNAGDFAVKNVCVKWFPYADESVPPVEMTISEISSDSTVRKTLVWNDGYLSWGLTSTKVEVVAGEEYIDDNPSNNSRTQDVNIDRP